MKDIFRVLRDERMGRLGVFSEVYLFGSILHRARPNDIDMLLVYRQYHDGDSMASEKRKVVDWLTSHTGIECHVVTLSEIELRQTKFLNYVDHVVIK